MDQIIEEWRPVIGYESLYEVSSLGRVKSVDRTVITINGQARQYKGKILSCAIANTGYPVVQIGKNNLMCVHVLVATAFLGPCPGRHGSGPDDWQVDHINCNRTDNRASNLQWLRCYENCCSKPAREGKRQSGESCAWSKLNAELVRYIRSSGKPGRDLAIELKVSEATISSVRNRKRWIHV